MFPLISGKKVDCVFTITKWRRDPQYPEMIPFLEMTEKMDDLTSPMKKFMNKKKVDLNNRSQSYKKNICLSTNTTKS